MEQFLFYLLRASVLMALFYGFYKLFFGKNTFHRFNRFSLITIVMMVGVLPFFRFNLLPEKKTEPLAIENLPIDFSTITVTEITELPEPRVEIPWTELLTAMFIIGFAFALVRYLIGLFQLVRIIRKSEKQTLADETVLCVTDKNISPFSWLKYIVMSQKDVTADNRAIINHEQAHIHLKHSMDMIFFDVFTCVFWFNPFSWLLRREIQSVHEYQADEQVLNNGIDAKQYQLLLIRKSVGEHKFALANNFRQRDLHKRITMMMKNKTKKRMKWAYAIGFPVLLLAMVALSVPKLNAKVVEEEVENSFKNEMITSIEDSLIIANNSVDLTQNPLELGNTQIISKKDYKDSIAQKNVEHIYIGKDGKNVYFTYDDTKLTVSGLVKGKEGFIPGVAILIKGSTVGTITDTKGTFVIKADKGDVLNFVMVGYKPFEYKVEKVEKNLVIVLQPDDVVAVGSGKMEDIEITTENGQKPRLVVRGTDMLKGKPLVIVDGIEVESMESVKPDNIESISVLKSSSATQLYGDKGRDGVFIITTKKATDLSVTGPQAGVTAEIASLSSRSGSDDKKPLIIVDGQKKGKDFNLNSISPADIESMTVLKDQSATAVYGEEAKNGVVEIMTKGNTKLKVSIENDGNHNGITTHKTGGVTVFGDFKNTEIYINGKKSSVEDVKKLQAKDVITMSTSPADLDYETDLHKKYNVPRNKGVIEIK